MDSLKKFLSYAVAVPAFLFFIGFGIRTTSTSPNHALLLVNEETKEYFAPPCLMHQGYDNVEAIYEFGRVNNLRVALNKEVAEPYQPNSECRDNSGFVQDGRSLSGMLLESIGLLPEKKSRWNPDGSWNF